MATKPRTKHRPRAPKDDRTRFDKFLDAARENNTMLTLHFSIPPLPTAGLSLDCMIMEVDRYMLSIWYDYNVIWVSKSIISSVQVTDES